MTRADVTLTMLTFHNFWDSYDLPCIHNFNVHTEWTVQWCWFSFRDSTPAGLQPWQPVAPVSPARPSPSSPSLSESGASSRPPRPVPVSRTAPSLFSLQPPGSAEPEPSLKPGRRWGPLCPVSPAGCSAPEEVGKQKDVEEPDCDLITSYKWLGETLQTSFNSIQF